MHVTYIEIFTFATSLFALGPGNPKKQFKYKIYVCSFALVFFTLAIYSINGRMQYVYPRLDLSVSTLDFVEWFMLGVLNASMFYTLSLRRVRDDGEHHRYRILLNYLRGADGVAFKAIIRLNIAGLLINVFVYTYDNYVWIHNVGFKTHQYYLYQAFQYFLVYLFSCIMTNVAIAFKCHLLHLAAELSAISIRNSDLRLRINDVIKSYEKFTMAQTAFNGLFGWSLLFFTISVILEIIEALNLGIIYSVQIGNRYMSTDFGVDLIILCIMWSLLLLSFLFTVLWSLHHTKKAHKLVGNSVYKLRLLLTDIGTCHSIPEVSQMDVCSIQMKLAVFHESMLDNPIVFTAAGFFECNYNLLTNVIASAASQIVTLIQINKADK